MKQKLFLCILSAALAAAVSCGKNGTDPEPDPNPLDELELVTYTESNDIIANPERGFYSTLEAHKASASGVTAARVNVARTQGRTLFLLEYYLTDYMESAIGDDYMDLIRNNFQALRDNGAKALVRFAYKNGYDEKDHPWDATEEQVLAHVAQLKPLLREYSDVIYTLQAGFVGAWGEWYYTDHFNMNPVSEASYQPRKHLLEALLDALPENRQVEVRTPAFKMKIFGFAVADTLTAAEAHQGTIKARIAGHNDCFLASDNDTGTYRGKSDREYWKAETRYTIMGGESCAVSNYCHCEDTGVPGAITTLEDYHFSYLHLGYHPQVIQMWKTEKCFDEIDRRLGYRLVLREGYFSPVAKAGESFRVVLKVDNVGFAAPMNPRDAEFVLTDASGKVLQTWKVDSDPRTWHSNEDITLDQTLTLPSGISGSVKLSLNLPDPEKTLRNNPRFSIQLANKDVWDETTGYNLIHTFTVE